MDTQYGDMDDDAAINEEELEDLGGDIYVGYDGNDKNNQIDNYQKQFEYNERFRYLNKNY